MKNNKSKSANREGIASPLEPTANSNVFSDVDGAYTGNPIDGEKPVQDADDL